MKYLKFFDNFDPKSEFEHREVTSPKVLSKLADLSEYLQSTDVYGLSIQGHLSDPPKGWKCNQWPINIVTYDSQDLCNCFIHFDCKNKQCANQLAHITVNKDTKFTEYKEDVYIEKSPFTGRSETLRKGLYLDSGYIHPVISEACGVDPKLNELVKDLITCIIEEELNFTKPTPTNTLEPL